VIVRDRRRARDGAKTRGASGTARRGGARRVVCGGRARRLLACPRNVSMADAATTRTRSALARRLCCASALVFAGCLPDSSPSAGQVQLTVYGFSVMKEPLEQGVFPAFAEKWKREHGVDVRFSASFAGSETVVNQILHGVGAHVAILSIERDAQRLKDGHVVTSDWHALPQQGIINRTPFVILVRRGNPKEIHDFQDLGRPGVKLLHPDPTSSGGAQWSLLALYGSELVKSEKDTGRADPERALSTLKAVWKNVIATPGSAREAMTQFQAGFGDALVTYELDALSVIGADAPFEIVVPRATIFSEHVAVVVDHNVDARTRPIVDAFVSYLWSDTAQASFVKSHLRAAARGTSNVDGDGFVKIELPFTVEYLGGWARAYPEIVEAVWRDRVQKSQ
jgi:sulfate transport system substrate-binding protein